MSYDYESAGELAEAMRTSGAIYRLAVDYAIISPDTIPNEVIPAIEEALKLGLAGMKRDLGET